MSGALLRLNIINHKVSKTVTGVLNGFWYKTEYQCLGTLLQSRYLFNKSKTFHHPESDQWSRFCFCLARFPDPLWVGEPYYLLKSPSSQTKNKCLSTRVFSSCFSFSLPANGCTCFPLSHYFSAYIRVGGCFAFFQCLLQDGWVVGGVTGEIDRNSGGDKDAV